MGMQPARESQTSYSRWNITALDGKFCRVTAAPVAVIAAQVPVVVAAVGVGAARLGESWNGGEKGEEGSQQFLGIPLACTSRPEKSRDVESLPGLIGKGDKRCKGAFCG